MPNLNPHASSPCSGLQVHRKIDSSTTTTTSMITVIRKTPFYACSICMLLDELQCLKWKIRGEGTLRQLWAPLQVALALDRFFCEEVCGVGTLNLNNWRCRNCVPLRPMVLSWFVGNILYANFYVSTDPDRNSAATKSTTTLKEPKPNMERRPSATLKPVCSLYVTVYDILHYIFIHQKMIATKHIRKKKKLDEYFSSVYVQLIFLLIALIFTSKWCNMRQHFYSAQLHSSVYSSSCFVVT